MVVNQNRATVLSRRELLVAGCASLAVCCTGVERASVEEVRNARFTARPHPVRSDASRVAAPWLHVPQKLREPAPLLLALHGAGGNGPRTLEYVRDMADGIGAIALAPSSMNATWDLLVGNLGADIARIDAQLDLVFDAYAIDGKHICVSGFSDGASYALTLGLANGDLFTHVIAFSPGFLHATGQVGAPRFFISHGNDDDILPIDRCSRRIVPGLRDAGYDVVYREFDGGHTVPEKIAAEAMEWFAA